MLDKSEKLIEQPFNSIAVAYDDDFTNSVTGKSQRRRVHFYLKKLVEQYKINTVLELNCGTGEDAVWLAKQGCKVLATDISETMIAVATQKVQKEGLQGHIDCQTLDIGSLDQLNGVHQYDLIFSDFGGLNCLGPKDLRDLTPTIKRLLKPGGFFVGVIMSRFCWWETLFFSLKREFKKAWRRRTKEGILAALDATTTVHTWYYSPKEFYQLFAKELMYNKSHPIGFMLPPSYLDDRFKNRPFLMKVLVKLEKWTPAVFAGCSDHYMIVLKAKKTK